MSDRQPFANRPAQHGGVGKNRAAPVPPDDYYSIESVFGKERPRSLYELGIPPLTPEERKKVAEGLTA